MTEVAEIAAWLIGPARLSGDASVVASGFVERVVALGLPVHRMRMAMRVDNPLLRAWGLSWTAESGSEVYTVLQTLLETPAYAGSPVEHVIETGQTFRRRLAALGASDHPVLHELAGQGYCDYFAVPVTFGNGVVQAAMFATRDEAGFGDDQVAAVEILATPLAAALEPIAMRRSTASLLAAFLGEGPAARVQAGAVRQGDVVETEAAILLADMRGFTPLSLTLPPDDLLKLLGRYFEVVVNAVRAEGGDVLKFIGDGVLAIFPVLGAERDRRAVCAAAVRAAARAVAAGEETSVPAFVTALHVGPVIYGNVGSASRLDFTVVGPTVNTVSRLELVAKANDERAVCSSSFARHLPECFVSELGVFELKGLKPQAVFAVATERFPRS